MLCVCVCVCVCVTKKKNLNPQISNSEVHNSSRTGCSTIDVQSKQTMQVNKNLDEPTCLWHNCSLLISSLYHSSS